MASILDLSIANTVVTDDVPKEVNGTTPEFALLAVGIQLVLSQSLQHFAYVLAMFGVVATEEEDVVDINDDKVVQKVGED